MRAAHQVQYTVRTALDRQMQETHQFWGIAINVNDVIREFDRMAGGKAYAINTVDSGNQTQQFGKSTGAAIVVFAAPGVDVLA
ncbi:hypothetical protein D3C72_1891520 [compost metagenome]